MKALFAAFFVFLNVIQAQSNASCYDDPQQPSCVNATIDDVTANMNISMACMMNSVMMYMPGCSIHAYCTSNASSNDVKESEYCRPFSELKSICSTMRGMSACWGFSHLCPKDGKTVVAACQTPVLPLPEDPVGLVTDICRSMFMSGCEKCINASGQNVMCDYLTVYTDLCLMMPEMPQCGKQKQYCHLIPSWPLCSSAALNMPRMQMYFHLGMLDYILFEQWVPVNTLYYALSIAVVFILAVISEGLKLVSQIVEDKLNNREKQQNDDYININNSLLGPEAQTYNRPTYVFWHELTRSLLYALCLLLHYFLMLISMTFNVGLFIAIILGAFFGHLITSIVKKVHGIQDNGTSHHHH